MTKARAEYVGILGHLSAITDVMRETGCTWDEAKQKLEDEWQDSSNVIYVDFRRRD